MTVVKHSSSTVCCFRSANRILRTVLIQRSQTPPWWDPKGGLKIHLTFCCRRNWWIFSWFQFSIALRISFSPLTKLLPLSDLITSGFPLLVMNLRRAWRNELVSRLCITSIWTARTAKHVNNTPYLFTRLRPLLTRNGPKQSTPTHANGGLSGVTRCCGRSAIFCSPTGACLLLQSTQLLKISFRIFRAPTIQKRSLINDRTCSNPLCPASWW
jgi:hypothetical protein